jgi:two-component system chemotaxis sensor kinase CheA
MDLEKRAVAAERTADVLKKKVYELYNGGGQSALHRQLEKSRRREENNRRKRELVELRAGELKRYSEELELEVARRTEAIKTILDNVTFGFLVVNRDLVVQPESTKSCERLFGTSEVEGANLCSLLQAPERVRPGLVLSVDQVFEDVLPTEASLAQIPRKFPMSEGRVLHVEGRALRSKGGEVAGLLLTISDISALEAATRESNNNRTLVNILKQRESFRGFMAEAKQQLEAVRRAVVGDNQSVARHLLHTIKGNSASYGLEDVVDLIHAVEDGSQIEPADIDRVAGALRQFLESNEAVLELRYDDGGGEGFAVTREQMSSLRSLISGMEATQAAELKEWTARVLLRPARQVLGPVEDFSQKLAARLGKSVELELNGADVHVDVETVGPVFQVVSHLLRNAVDHGIEGPAERRGKPPSGRIGLDLAETPSEYVLRCSDDGRGIDTDLLGRRAVELGFAPAETIARMDERTKLELVFVEGLSCAAVTTSISGRGVGMSAVREAVKRVGGQIDVESARGLGTRFTVTIPKNGDSTSAAHGAPAPTVTQ